MRGLTAARGVHGALKRIALPAKDVIGVLTVARHVTSGKCKGLSGGWPLGLVVELGGVPDNLIHELRDADRVGGRAVATQAQEGGGTADGIGDVVLVVGTVKVLSIPARWEMDVGADT